MDTLITDAPKASPLSGLARMSRRVLFAIPLMAAVFASPGQAQTCDPEVLYDTITSSFHQTVAQRTDGSWAGWGQDMSNSGTANITSPQDLNAANYAALGAHTPYLVTTGSTSTTHQSVMLTSDGLYAWGRQNVIVPQGGGYTSGTAFQKLTFGSDGNGMPAGVAPSNVAQLFSTWKALTIVTKNGQAWTLVTSSGSGTIPITGDNTASDNTWHRVSTAANTPLTSVVALRGQVSSDTRGAFMALTSDGRAWTWGRQTLLGDGTVATDRGFATEMLLPHQADFALLGANEAALHATVQNSAPKMIGVTGATIRNTARINSYFVLYENGRLFSMGANDERQLGDFTTTNRTTWVAVLKPSAGDANVHDGAFDNVRTISVQEHDRAQTGAGGPAAALITNGGVLYTWGTNNGRMIGRKHGNNPSANNPTTPSPAGPAFTSAETLADGCTTNAARACHPGIPQGFLPGSHFAKLVEVGGHTTVYMRERSAKFCYVGHRIAGSMGHGIADTVEDYGPFNCEETPVINICGSTGYDYGDAPFVYEAGGGGNLASHFYIEQELPNPPDPLQPITNRLYLGDNWPRVNDDTPHNVVIQTDNMAPSGDCGNWPGPGCEEDAVVGALPEAEDTDTTYSLTIKVNNRALNADKEAVPARLYAWVDWNNDSQFSANEFVASGSSDVSGALALTGGALIVPACAPLPTPPAECQAGSGEHAVTLSWTGLAGLTPGWRYVRLRVTTASNLADNPLGGIDERALKFAGDGEMEDFRLLIKEFNAPENEPPIGIDVHADQVPINAPPVQLQVGGLPAALQGWDGDGSVVSYRIQTLPACHVAVPAPPAPLPANSCRLYKMVGSTRMLLTAGEPITLAQAQNLWFETNQTTGTFFTFRAIDDDGDESVNRACDSLVDDCDNTDLPGALVAPARDAIFTIPVAMPNVSVTKDTGALVEVAPGASFDYTITVTNAGPGWTANSVVVQDQLPAGMVATAVAGANCGAMPSAAGALLTCTVAGPIAAGDNVPFTLTVTAPSGSGAITNYVATHPPGDGNPPSTPPGTGCNPATTSCDDHPITLLAPNVSVTKTSSATEVAPGASFDYTLTVTNNGGAPTAATVVVQDQLPTGMTATAVVGATCTPALPSGGLLTCTVPGPIAAGGNAAFTLTVTAPATTGTATNYAATNPDGGGGNPPSPPGAGCNPATTSCANVPVDVVAPRVSVTKTSSATEVAPGASFTYTLTVTNGGTAPTAATVVVQDQLPTGMTATAVSGATCTPALPSGGLLTCTVPGPIAAGGNAAFTLTVTAPATTGQVINYAATNPDGGGGNPPSPPGAGCNPATTSCANVPVDVVAPRVTVTKTSSVTEVAVGGSFDYTLTVTNGGTAPTAATVVVQDQLPTGMTATAVSGATCTPALPSSGLLTCTVPGPIAAGGNAAFTLTVTAPATTGTATNYAATNPDGGGGNPPSPPGAGCNPATTSCANVPVDVVAPRVTVTKTTDITEVIAGASFTYTLTVTNNGTAPTAATVVVQDQLPAGMVATAVSGATCTPALPSTAGALLTCTLPGPIAVGGGTAAFTLTVTAPATPGSLINYAATNPDGSGSNPPTPPGTSCDPVTTSCDNAPIIIRGVATPPRSIPVDSPWALLLLGMGMLLLGGGAVRRRLG